ncbi:MAG: prepilin-type N-terminal cleavage/methylation domain-containing protein [Candidatus Paceibacterota bacterium]
MWQSTNKSKQGFTLTELMVVLSIIAILSAVTWINYSQSSAKSRDSKRQTDLKMLQAAIETYKKDHGRYPAGCNGANNWSGQLDTTYACTDGSRGEYIIGLAPTYIPVLPKDVKLNGANSGYVYRTNAEGTVYKLKAQRTVEADTITHTHPLKPCDIRVAHAGSGSLTNNSQDPRVIGWCGRVYNSSANSYTLPSTCNSTQDDWRISYGLWGGLSLDQGIITQGNLNNAYAADPLANIFGANEGAKNRFRAQAIFPTADVICK